MSLPAGFNPHPDLSTKDVFIDRENAFLLFAANLGDVEKTAFSLGIDAVSLLRVVDQEGWCKKLEPILEKIKSEKSGDVSRGINRALNFCLAHRFRLVLQRALRVMCDWNDDQLIEALTPPTADKAGNLSRKVSTRWAADFSAALEKMAAMSYAATADSSTERVKRDSTAVGDNSPIDIHSLISRAMSGAGASKTPRALLLDATLEISESIAQQAVIPRKPVPSLDDTYEGDQQGG